MIYNKVTLVTHKQKDQIRKACPVLESDSLDIWNQDKLVPKWREKSDEGKDQLMIWYHTISPIWQMQCYDVRVCGCQLKLGDMTYK